MTSPFTLRPLCFAWLWLVASVVRAAEPALSPPKPLPPEVLVINSYHPGYRWTDEETSGIKDVLGNKDRLVRFAIEYLDWKRFPTPENEAQFLALLTSKYASHPLQAVITTDDAALEFLLRHRAEIAPGAPAVFCGVSENEYERLRGQTGITGVLEKLGVAETLSLATKLQPQATRVFLAHDLTDAGLASRAAVEKAAKAWNDRLKFEYAGRTSFPELFDRVGKFGPDTIVIYTGLAVDSLGALGSRQTRFDFARASKAPVYVLSSDIFADIGVGGCVISGVQQGEAAARMALLLLAGESIGRLPVQTNPPLRTVVDFQRLTPAGISPNLAPPGVEIIHRPDSALERYRWQLAGAAGFVLALGVSIVVLSLNVRARKKAEENLRRNEARTRMILDSALDAVVVMDAEGLVTSWNPQAVTMFGLPPETATGRKLAELIVPAPLRPGFEREIDTLQNDPGIGRAHRTFELAALRRDGSEFPAEFAVTRLRLDTSLSYSVFVRDLTEAKRATETLDQTVELYRQAISAAGAVPYIHDYPTESYTYMGAEIVQLTGYSPEEMNPVLWNRISQEIILFGDTGAAGGETEAVNLAREGKLLHWRSDSKILTKEGQTRWISDASVEILGPDGKSTGSIGVLIDITDRKRAEQELRESEQRFRLMVENLPAGAVYVDRPSGQLHANKEAEAITGLPRQEVNDIEQWFPALWGEQAGEIRRLYESDRLAGFPSPRVIPISRKDGQLRIVEFAAYGFSSGEIWLLHDITERKRAEEALRESEERFRTVVENLGEAVIITDLEEVILYVNGQILQITGHRPADLLGKPVAAVFDAQNQTAKYFARNDRSPRPGLVQFETPAQRKDGRQIWLQISVTPFRETGGRIIGNVGVVSDLTERKQADTRLRQAQKMEAIGTLAGGIAHDFNNILGALLLFCELASFEASNNPRMSEYLAGMLKSCHRARELVKQILTFSRQQEQTRETISLEPVVEDALKLMRASLPAMIEIRGHIAPGLPPVIADSTQIHQVLMNLCANAAHAMREGPGRLEVDLAPVEVEGDLAASVPELKPGLHARLSVSDTGHGMDSATQERIFEPFFTTKATGEGTGLGLSVVHGIVRGHDGAITVRSSPGQGTTFHVYLPAATHVTQPRPVETDGPAPGRGEKVLLVDDELALLDAVTRMLAKLDYRVTAKARPEEAVDALENEPGSFDAAVIDLSMPRMNGLDLAIQLRQRQPGLPIILTSGHLREEDVERARAIGINRLIPKPYTQAEIGAALSELLTASRLKTLLPR
ncbi:MAG TPA: PAS domain S-box protein [Verrucomicrobiae bacterium]|nr:PAS domain S-box protein [Verrucomicrobiae bacterium]